MHSHPGMNHNYTTPAAYNPASNPFTYPGTLSDAKATASKPSTKVKEDVDVTKMDVESMLDVTSYGGVNVNEGNKSK